MTATKSRMIFVNLAVSDLKRSVDFFTKLGFSFDQRFTDETATSMIVDEGHSYVMLLVRDKFTTFTNKQICDTSKFTEGLFCISAESREAVDAMVNTAVAHGGSLAHDKQDHGFMYGWSFYDPDGHHWEVMWMDPNAVPPAQ
jgi:predicted lactoylglutathione lyase